MSKKSATKAVKEEKPMSKHVDFYSLDDLVEAHKELGYSKECVMAALKFNGITHCDVETAKNIIKKFMGRVIV